MAQDIVNEKGQRLCQIFRTEWNKCGSCSDRSKNHQKLNVVVYFEIILRRVALLEISKNFQN